MISENIQEHECFIIQDNITGLYVYIFRNECSRGFSCFVERNEATVFHTFPAHLESRFKYHAEREDRSLRILRWSERVRTVIETDILEEECVIESFG